MTKLNDKSLAQKADIDAINVQYQKALKLLHYKINLKPYDIKLITRNDNGYSNDTFNVITKKHKHLIVRVGHPDNLYRRVHEKAAIKLANKVNKVNILYDDAKTGDQIREAFEKDIPTTRQIHTKKFLKLLANKIQALHNINIKNVKLEKMNYSLYDAHINQVPAKFTNLFYSILNKYENKPLVFSHNDLTIWNIIYDEKHSEIALIDFEWSGLNNQYFDIANFIRDTNLHNTALEKYFLKQFKKPISVNDVTLFVYVSSYFSYLWTYSVELKPHILRYRNSVGSKVNKLYNYITKHNMVKIFEYASKIKTKQKSKVRKSNLTSPINIVYDLVKKYLHADKKDISSLKLLRSGQTNLSYHLKLKNNYQYYIRIGTIHQHLHHEIEGEIIKTYAKHINQKVIYFDSDTGNCIKTWIPGSSTTKKQLQDFKFYDMLIKQLKTFHNMKIKTKVPKIDWNLYEKYKSCLEVKYYLFFQKLIKELSKEKTCLCHNDCTPWNTIINKNKLSLIDVEWIRVSNVYTDIANFIREARLHNTEYEDYILKHYYIKLNKAKLTKMLYILSCYAYMWAHSHPNFKILNKYQQVVKNDIVKLYPELNK